MGSGSRHLWRALVAAAIAAAGWLALTAVSRPGHSSASSAIETKPVIVGVITIQASPFSATVSWSTNVPARSIVEYGTSTSYGLWSPSDAGSSSLHTLTLSGLQFGRTYHYRVISRNGAGEVMGTDAMLATPRLGQAPLRSGISSGRQVLVDGHPFFPIMQWLQCPSLFKVNVSLGVNTFLGQGCSNSVSDELAQTARLGALSVLPFDAAAKDAPSLLGWRGPDEPDGSGIKPRAVRAAFATNRAADPNHINLLTLSSNFFNQLSPPAWMHGDRTVYRQYTAATDFPGFDVYPIYGWCRPDSIWWEAASAAQFGRTLAQGKPFYSWIEAASTSSQFCRGRGVQADELRAEVWMAITNGARGIGYFTHSWTPTYSQFRVSRSVQAEIQRTDRQITDLSAPLLGPAAHVSGAAVGGAGPVDFLARRFDGATYVFAVNTGRSPVKYRFTGAALAHVTATVFEEHRSLKADGEGFSDSFAPLAVHIYIVPPRGASY